VSNVDFQSEASAIGSIIVRKGSREISVWQLLVLFLCVLINATDGYDILVMAFIAPTLGPIWKLSGSQIGIIFSGNLLGLAIGALILSPRADKLGRRPVVIIALAIVTAGMLASALSPSYWWLVTFRIFTGIGIGGLVTSTAVVVAELIPTRFRSSAIAMLGVGLSVGGISGGALARWTLEHFGWRMPLIIGGLVSVVLIVLSIAFLPESMEFLVSRQPKDALKKLNRILSRMNCRELENLPVPVSTLKSHTKANVSALFDGGERRKTLLLWSAYFLQFSGLYFVVNWTPKLLAQNAATLSAGIDAGLALNIGGLLGALAFSVIAPWFELRRLTVVLFVLASIATAGFGLLFHEASVVMPMAMLVGTCAFTVMAALNSIGPVAYRPDIRGLGLGWAVGIGRIGAIVSPSIAGVLVDLDVGRTALYLIFSVPFAFGALAILMLSARRPSVERGAIAG
jgi:benzoate transport